MEIDGTSAWRWILGFVAVYGAAIGGLLIGVTYYLRAEGTATLWRRLIASLYGPAIGLILVVATLWPDRYRYQQRGIAFFYWLQVVPFSLLIYSLVRYPGRRVLHLFLVPIALACWLWVFAIGFLEIHGE